MNNSIDTEWWKQGVIYHIYPMSFCDSNGDGIGDLQGIIQKLDYLSNLNIAAIWLSPIYKSPQIDMGYDISDFCNIEPWFGTMNDFDELLAACHSRNIRVIMDLIMNHTSDQHPWFIESASSKDNPKRNWYIWDDGNHKKPINNWRSAYGGSAWQFHHETESFYLHSFFKEQPDLNWRCKEMGEAFFKMVDFWLLKGVDGFRLDVINVVVKDKKLRSNPNFFNIQFLQKNMYNRNRKGSFRVIEMLRNQIDTYKDRILVGEIYVLPPGNHNTVFKYIRTDKEKLRLNLAFDFSLIFRSFSARTFYKYADKWDNNVKRIEGACHVFSNHDLGREINRRWFRFYKLESAKLIAMFQFTLKGTPFVYYGEEIGMRNIPIPKNEIRDPLGQKYWPFYTGRDKSRTPMQWDNSEHAGFSSVKPWLPVDTQKDIRCVAKQEQNEFSMLQYYKKLIKIRNNHLSITQGVWIPINNVSHGILAYFRIHNYEKLLIILNFNIIKTKFFFPKHAIFISICSSKNRKLDEIYSDSILLSHREGIIFKEIREK